MKSLKEVIDMFIKKSNQTKEYKYVQQLSSQNSVVIIIIT